MGLFLLETVSELRFALKASFQRSSLLVFYSDLCLFDINTRIVEVLLLLLLCLFHCLHILNSSVLFIMFLDSSTGVRGGLYYSSHLFPTKIIQAE